MHITQIMEARPSRAEAPGDYVYRLAFAFCLTFGAYFAVANQLTAVMGQDGFFMLSAIQGGFLLGTLLGPRAAARRKISPEHFRHIGAQSLNSFDQISAPL